MIYKFNRINRKIIKEKFLIFHHENQENFFQKESSQIILKDLKPFNDEESNKKFEEFLNLPENERPIFLENLEQELNLSKNKLQEYQTKLQELKLKNKEPKNTHNFFQQLNNTILAQKSFYDTFSKRGCHTFSTKNKPKIDNFINNISKQRENLGNKTILCFEANFYPEKSNSQFLEDLITKGHIDPENKGDIEIALKNGLSVITISKDGYPVVINFTTDLAAITVQETITSVYIPEKKEGKPSVSQIVDLEINAFDREQGIILASFSESKKKSLISKNNDQFSIFSQQNLDSNDKNNLLKTPKEPNVIKEKQNALSRLEKAGLGGTEIFKKLKKIDPEKKIGVILMAPTNYSTYDNWLRPVFDGIHNNLKIKPQMKCEKYLTLKHAKKEEYLAAILASPFVKKIAFVGHGGESMIELANGVLHEDEISSFIAKNADKNWQKLKFITKETCGGVNDTFGNSIAEKISWNKGLLVPFIYAQKGIRQIHSS